MTESVSPKKVNAPSNVQSGAVERIGEPMVNGRCLKAKKVHIHELTTSMDFRNINFWTSYPENGTKKKLPANCSFKKVDKRINGKKMMALVNVEKNNTGNTALFSSDFFLKIS